MSDDKSWNEMDWILSLNNDAKRNYYAVSNDVFKLCRTKKAIQECAQYDTNHKTLAFAIKVPKQRHKRHTTPRHLSSTTNTQSFAAFTAPRSDDDPMNIRRRLHDYHYDGAVEYGDMMGYALWTKDTMDVIEKDSFNARDYSFYGDFMYSFDEHLFDFAKDDDWALINGDLTKCSVTIPSLYHQLCVDHDHSQYQIRFIDSLDPRRRLRVSDETELLHHLRHDLGDLSLAWDDKTIWDEISDIHDRNAQFHSIRKCKTLQSVQICATIHHNQAPTDDIQVSVKVGRHKYHRAPIDQSSAHQDMVNIQWQRYKPFARLVPSSKPSWLPQWIWHHVNHNLKGIEAKASSHTQINDYYDYDMELPPKYKSLADLKIAAAEKKKQSKAAGVAKKKALAKKKADLAVAATKKKKDAKADMKRKGAVAKETAKTKKKAIGTATGAAVDTAKTKVAKTGTAISKGVDDATTAAANQANKVKKKGDEAIADTKKALVATGKDIKEGVVDAAATATEQAGKVTKAVSDKADQASDAIASGVATGLVKADEAKKAVGRTAKKVGDVVVGGAAVGLDAAHKADARVRAFQDKHEGTVKTAKKHMATYNTFANALKREGIGMPTTGEMGAHLLKKGLQHTGVDPTHLHKAVAVGSALRDVHQALQGEPIASPAAPAAEAAQEHGAATQKSAEPVHEGTETATDTSRTADVAASSPPQSVQEDTATATAPKTVPPATPDVGAAETIPKTPVAEGVAPAKAPETPTTPKSIDTSQTQPVQQAEGSPDVGANETPPKPAKSAAEPGTEGAATTSKSDGTATGSADTTTKEASETAAQPVQEGTATATTPQQPVTEGAVSPKPPVPEAEGTPSVSATETAPKPAAESASKSSEEGAVTITPKSDGTATESAPAKPAASAVGVATERGASQGDNTVNVPKQSVTDITGQSAPPITSFTPKGGAAVHVIHSPLPATGAVTGGVRTVAASPHTVSFEGAHPMPFAPVTHVAPGAVTVSGSSPDASPCCKSFGSPMQVIISPVIPIRSAANVIQYEDEIMDGWMDEDDGNEWVIVDDGTGSYVQDMFGSLDFDDDSIWDEIVTDIETIKGKDLDKKCMNIFGRTLCLCEFIDWVNGKRIDGNTKHVCYASAHGKSVVTKKIETKQKKEMKKNELRQKLILRLNRKDKQITTHKVNVGEIAEHKIEKGHSQMMKRLSHTVERKTQTHGHSALPQTHGHSALPQTHGHSALPQTHGHSALPQMRPVWLPRYFWYWLHHFKTYKILPSNDKVRIAGAHMNEYSDVYDEQDGHIRMPDFNIAYV
eukprot:132348_1